MTTALVTGGAGFIGSHIADLLIERGISVRVVDDLSTGTGENVNSKATFVEGSVTDADLLRDVMHGVDYVFHTAALARIQPSFDDPVSHEDVNVIGTLRCMEAARTVPGLRKVVVSASSACYGTPTQLPTSEDAAIRALSPYAVQKYSAEQQALLLGDRFSIPVIALRYFNVYGARSFNPKNPFNAYTSVLGIFEDQRARGMPLTVTGDGEQTRDFVHVRDVARANLMAAESDLTGRVFNVGTGVTTSINGIARMFGTEIMWIPEREGEARVTWADIGRIRTELGWSPEIDVDRGIHMLS